MNFNVTDLRDPPRINFPSKNSFEKECDELEFVLINFSAGILGGAAIGSALAIDYNLNSRQLYFTPIAITVVVNKLFQIQHRSKFADLKLMKICHGFFPVLLSTGAATTSVVSLISEGITPHILEGIGNSIPKTYRVILFATTSIYSIYSAVKVIRAFWHTLID